MLDVEETLRKLYKEKYCDPDDYVVTRWASDPYSLGSYSFIPKGARKVGYRSASC